MTTTKKIVFLHGFMGSALNWGRIRSLIETYEDIESYALDLLGHALNHPKDAAAYNNANLTMSNDLIEQLDKIKPTHVVAHSFALRPTLLVGQKRPDLIPHLIVEDSAPELSASAHKFLMDVINAPVPFRTREEAKAYFESKYGIQSVLSRFFLSNIRSRPDGLADWRFDKRFLECLINEALKKDLWAEWKSFPNETSLIYGLKSEGMSKDLVLKMQSLRSSVKTLGIEGAGHWVHSDQAELFVKAIVSLL
jgi:pimeloyl-ACP methyl ester carboxylesterase